MDMIGTTTEISISTTCVNSCSEAMITGHKHSLHFTVGQKCKVSTPNALVLAFSCGGYTAWEYGCAGCSVDTQYDSCRERLT